MCAKHPDLSPKVQSPTLSIPQTGTFLGCGRSLIYSLIGSGDLPARKLGRRTVVLRRDAEALLERLPLASVTVTPRVEPAPALGSQSLANACQVPIAASQ
jgi:predicted DNA-binding transcriptional regulator AlpA